MPITLTEDESCLCIVALDDTAKTLKEGQEASVRLGSPIDVSSQIDLVRNLSARLRAALQSSSST